jgi:spermidine synthase
MAFLLCVIFFLSGSAALLFETVWFRVAGLTLGNSVWASNIVLASFMAGLAAGNAGAARYGRRLTRPLFVYAIIECIVGLAGVAIVVLLPPLSPLLAPLFTRVLAHVWLVNVIRLTVAFVLMLVPTTAMGLTLPLLTKALTRSDGNFGRALGRLYGWNTLGGVAGALAGEFWLISWLGQRGTALAAAALNVTAAVVALLLTRHIGEAGVSEAAPASAQRRSARSWRLLSAAFVAGGSLLALEVVWFRFMLLWVFGTSLVFATMLAVILLGIGAGGLAASQWLGRDPQAQRFTSLVAFGAGIATVLSYVLFDPRAGRVLYDATDARVALILSLRLMLPTALLSGMLFTLLGAAQREECGEASEAAGKLTLANTLGAMAGALLAGFVMLPLLGMEKSLFALALCYGATAAFSMDGSKAAPLDGRRRTVAMASAALFVGVLVLFPFGFMRARFFKELAKRVEGGSDKVIGVQEGLTETITYTRADWYGQPVYYRLITNGHSMSATNYVSRRYMKMYVYWALAVNPEVRKALLVSYGVGNTAKALADTRQLDSIDVVDISRDILDLSAVVFPGASNPLRDPRMRVHIEDGRFFLETTAERFDLITSEPPPPRAAGITNLYSREYFKLIYDHLRDGGVVTYWLPVYQLHQSETQAIMRGFCDAFPDCSLWSGAGVEWMLAGTRGARGPVPEERFSAQWRDPVVGPELVAVGLERPEQLGSAFIADATTLAEWTRDMPVLDDDHPGRILPWPPKAERDPYYRAWGESEAARRRFASSALIQGLWPPRLRRRSEDYFEIEAMLNDSYAWHRRNPIELLHAMLTTSALRVPSLVLMGTEPTMVNVAMRAYGAGARGSQLEFQFGAKALSERDYSTAAQHFAVVDEAAQHVTAQLFRSLALGLLDRKAEAQQVLDSIGLETMSGDDATYVLWLERLWRRGGPQPAGTRPR